jgi:GNAT superfamily N-acetyltransferase
VKITDLLTITRMADTNMTGVDPQFTELVNNPFGRFMGFFLFPFYFGLSGKGFKALYNGQIVGCAYLHLNKHSGYIFNVNVNGAYRRRGVGRQLMNHLESVTRKHHRYLLALQVDDNNQPAKRLYHQLGYRPFHPHFLRYELTWGLRQGVESAVALEPLPHIGGRRFFNRHQQMERQKGDAWAFKAVEDYQESEVVESGKYWRCLLNGEEAGAACQQKTNGGITLTLAMKPDFWGHVGESGLVKQLIGLSPQDRPRIDLFFSSSGHYRASVSMFKALGFKEMIQPRLLMIKEINDSEVRPDTLPSL